jgi:phosphoribosyl-dephospho-CoA transferase
MTINDRILMSWTMRRCFLCEQQGACGHREYDVERAIAEVEEKQEFRKMAKPVKREKGKVRKIA